MKIEFVICISHWFLLLSFTNGARAAAHQSPPAVPRPGAARQPSQRRQDTAARPWPKGPRPCWNGLAESASAWRNRTLPTRRVLLDERVLARTIFMRKETHASSLGAVQMLAAQLWPAAALIAEELGAIPALVENKCVLEIGAGAALPSVCAALARAHAVLVTDYPDSRMLDNIRANITRNLGHAQQQGVRVVGYDWSQCPERLLTELSHLLEE
eukprot:6188363-Pleurochrysis_carterae.AAC.1